MSLYKFENRDCMEGMKEYPDKYFDLAIVDPPYGIGKFTCEKHTNNDGKRISNNKIYSDSYDWNNSIPANQYFDELKRISKNRIIWGANYYNCFENRGGALVWYKGDMTETISHCEIASLSFQTRVSYVQVNWQSGFFRKNKEGEQIHPCQKPIALYKWILLKYAKEGDKILDTHVGSASSIIACLDMGFDVTGYELDKDYFEKANERISKHLQQEVFDFSMTPTGRK